MVPSRGDGEIVAVVTDLLHPLLVDNGPHEAVKGALTILDLQLGGARNAGDGISLHAIEGVQDGLQGILRRGEALREEAERRLDDRRERAEPLLQCQLGVHEGDVLASGRVGRELEQALLLEDLASPLAAERLDQLVAGLVGVHGRDALEAHERELGGDGDGVRLGPLPGLGAVQPRADHVQDEHDTDADQDPALDFELREGVPLVDIVPL